MKEVDVARPVVAELRAMQFEVYQEVLLPSGLGVADIVAVNGHLVWIIETKTSLSWDLLAQAEQRRRWAHKVSVAVPKKKRRTDGEHFAFRLCAKEGFGVLTVSLDGEVREEVPPRLVHRRSIEQTRRLRQSLVKEQKDFAEAGTAGGGYWSPFKNTCQRVLRKVKEKPGLSAKELVDSIDHHYRSSSTAKACIIKWARAGIIPGVELRQEGRKLSFYPKE